MSPAAGERVPGVRDGSASVSYLLDWNGKRAASRQLGSARQMTVGRFLNGGPLALVTLWDSIGITFWMMTAAGSPAAVLIA